MAEGNGAMGGEIPTSSAENNQNFKPQASTLENQKTPEQQEALAKATKKVIGLYMGDKMSILLGTQGSEQRDGVWAKATQELGAFSDKAKELRDAMKGVMETKKAYPPQIEAIYKLPFAGLKDKMATEYLGDVLFSRMTVSQGYLDYGKNAAEESEQMAVEMGNTERWGNDPSREVTLEKAVAATLEGKLRITHQPQTQPNS